MSGTITNPLAIVTDGANLYVGVSPSYSATQIIKIDYTGTISILAGNFQAPNTSGVDGTGTSATFWGFKNMNYNPIDNHIYIIESYNDITTGFRNNIRKVSLGGVVTTLNITLPDNTGNTNYKCVSPNNINALYVVNSTNGNVYSITNYNGPTPTVTYIASFGAPPISQMLNLDCVGNGIIYGSLLARGVIYVIDTINNSISTINTTPPPGLTINQVRFYDFVASNGLTYSCDAQDFRIYEINGSNNVTILASGAPNWNGPYSLAHISHYLYVCILNNSTIAILDLNNPAAYATFSEGTPLPSGGPPYVPCFPKGSSILTSSGYKPVETLTEDDTVRTADGRDVHIKPFQFTIKNPDSDSAPYRISAGALGHYYPPEDVCLSPRHTIQDSRGVWQTPKRLAMHNPLVQQYGLGEPIKYYHIECPDFFTDDLVVGGAVVESFKNRQGPSGIVYVWNRELNGFVRNKRDQVTPVPKNPHTLMLTA